MEYAQWESRFWLSIDGNICLNPCFNGICSMRVYKLRYRYTGDFKGLNPCFNGICSMRVWTLGVRGNFKWSVLILVLMEYAQWEFQRLPRTGISGVLILVLMEYAQWVSVQWSTARWPDFLVLILVLMEYAQWEQKLYISKNEWITI